MYMYLQITAIAHMEHKKDDRLYKYIFCRFYPPEGKISKSDRAKQ